MTAPDDRNMVDVLRGSRILAYSVGVLSLAAGVVLAFWPDRTITVIARIAGLLIFAAGIGETVDAATTHRKGSYWGLLVVRGLLNVGFGALLLFWPGITVTVLVWLFGIDLIVTGVIGLLVSGRVDTELGRRTLRIRSVVGILFGLVVVAWPDVTLAVLALLIAIQLIVAGLVLLWSGYALGRAAGAAT